MSSAPHPSRGVGHGVACAHLAARPALRELGRGAYIQDKRRQSSVFDGSEMPPPATAAPQQRLFLFWNLDS